MSAPPRDLAMTRLAGTPPGLSAQAGGDCFCRRFAADPLNVRATLRAAVARFARRMTPADAGTVELTLGEVLNNIVEHAYADGADGQVEIALRHSGGALDCRIEDHGRPMPDLDLPARTLPATDVPFADLAEGGWGWVLIRDLTEDLAYRREDGRNCLTFRIPLGVR